MRFFKKNNIIIALTISLLLVIGNMLTVSDERKIIIKDVVISKNNNLYNLNFNQVVKLDNSIREAIDKGIPLVFKLILKVVQLNEIFPTESGMGISTEILRLYEYPYEIFRFP